MALCVLIGVPTVREKVPTLTHGVELPHLNVPLNRGEGCLAIKGYSKAGLFLVNCPSLTFSPLYSSKKIRDSCCEPKLIRTLVRTEHRLCIWIYVVVDDGS